MRRAFRRTSAWDTAGWKAALCCPCKLSFTWRAATWKRFDRLRNSRPGRVTAARRPHCGAEAEYKQNKLNDVFWLHSSGQYAFAIANDGKPVDEPSVLATVPEWWGLLDLRRAQTMIEDLANESHAADWGMRIISSKKEGLYNPAGYHFGSVWPLFTGWASVGEYRAHKPVPALANLKANSWLALNDASGNTTEVLSGESYSPLSTASPHQIWSAAMVISPLLRGLFGVE